MSSRCALIGDVGGHANVLSRCIRSVGGDPDSGTLPDDLSVVQVGDLVDGGPTSDECVAIADRMLANARGRWIQLLGNHDIRYLGGPRKPGWSLRPEVSDATKNTLRSWWDGKRARMSVGLLDAQFGPMLVTHAGLTLGFWRELGSPSLPTAVRELNDMVPNDKSRAFRPGCVVTGTRDASAGCCWAEVNNELYEPWIEWSATNPLPFSQVHGHDAPYNWRSSTFWPSANADIRRRCNVDNVLRRTTTILGRDVTNRPALAISVDWNLGSITSPDEGWPLLILHGDPLLL